MFANTYQSGQAVEVFSPAGKDPLKAWKVTTGLRKAYDKALRGFIVQLEAQAAQMQIPTSSRLSLGLVQPVLVLQLMIPPEKPFGFEIILTDDQSRKRRLIFSTNFREVEATQLHAKIALYSIPRNVWVNLVLDLPVLLDSLYRVGYQEIDNFTLKAFCSLRKIFTVNEQPDDSTYADFLPSAHAFPRGFDHQTLVVKASAKKNATTFTMLPEAPLPEPPPPPAPTRITMVPADAKGARPGWALEKASASKSELTAKSVKGDSSMSSLNTTAHSNAQHSEKKLRMRAESVDEYHAQDSSVQHNNIHEETMYIREELLRELQEEQLRLAMLERAFVAEFGLSALQSLDSYHGHAEGVS